MSTVSFDNTVLLLHCNDYTDSGKNNLTVNKIGNVPLVDAKFDKGYFINSDNRASIQLDNLIDMNQDFTIDFWIKIDDTMDGKHGEIFEIVNEDNLTIFNCDISDDKYAGVGFGGNFMTSYSTVFENADAGEIYHVAMVKKGNERNFYLNGILSDALNEDIVKNSAGLTLFLGESSAEILDDEILSWIDEFRITNIAVWDSNFIPPVSPYNEDNMILDSLYTYTDGTVSLTDEFKACVDANPQIDFVIGNTTIWTAGDPLPNPHRPDLDVKYTVTSMEDMFRNYFAVTSLDLSNFDTSLVTNMRLMFSNCSHLTLLNISSFKTKSVVDMSYMFTHCLELTNIDVLNFDTSSVTTMEGMFNMCLNVPTLNLSNFNTQNVLNISNMFNNCQDLTKLDLTSFDISKVTNTDGMVQFCFSITTAYARTQVDADRFNSSLEKPDNVNFIAPILNGDLEVGIVNALGQNINVSLSGKEVYIGTFNGNKKVLQLYMGAGNKNALVYNSDDPNAKYYFLEDSEQFVLQDSETFYLKPRWVNQLQDVDLKLLEDEVGLKLISEANWKLKDDAIFYIKDKDGNFIGTKEV